MIHLALTLPLLLAQPEPSRAMILDPVAGSFRGREVAGAYAGVLLSHAAIIGFTVAMKRDLFPVEGRAFRGAGWWWAAPLLAELTLPGLLGPLGAYLCSAPPLAAGFGRALGDGFRVHAAMAFIGELLMIVGLVANEPLFAVGGAMELIAVDEGLSPWLDALFLHSVPWHPEPPTIPPDVTPPTGPAHEPPPHAAKTFMLPLAFHF